MFTKNSLLRRSFVLLGPTVVEYRFGNANNQSSSRETDSDAEPNSARRNYAAAAIWGAIVVLTAAAMI